MGARMVAASDGRVVGFSHELRVLADELPVLADIQFAALVCGAHPYKIVQSHWHASPTEQLMEKLGIDWEKKKAEFEEYLKDVEAGNGETLYDPRRMITSGPGYKVRFGSATTFVPVLGSDAAEPASWTWRTESVRMGDQTLVRDVDEAVTSTADWRFERRWPTGVREVCLVLVSGQAHVKAGGDPLALVFKAPQGLASEPRAGALALPVHRATDR